MANIPNYYSNPAFCQQSEYNNGQRPPPALSPQRNVRQSPVGAQAIHRVLDTSGCDNPALEEEDVQEQEFYEEVLVDDKGFITEKKFVIVAQNNEGKKYIQLPQHEEPREGSRYGVPSSQERQSGRYGVPQQLRFDPPRCVESSKPRNHRYEYIPMQEQDRYAGPKQSPKKKEVVESDAPSRVNRYAVITENETELTTNNGRYALVPVEVLNSVIPPQPSQNRHRYEYVQDLPRQPTSPNPNRYEYIQTSPPKLPPNTNRYEYLQVAPQRVGNPIATQKLHELLTTPKKSPSQSAKKVQPPPISPIPKEQFQTPPKQRQAPKAQQKLNYALGTRQLVQQDKRHTAIVAPLCSSPSHSVYSETTYSKSESWMNLSMGKVSGQATFAIAAIVMLLCGGVTSGLCFYMISVLGRLYYLDLGLVSGFTCLILGLVGFRMRAVYWLPNRNYVSGYLVLSVFSLLTCVGLVTLLVMQPRPGTPLADITSGAVCGISALSLLLAVTGVVSSYCCKYPPPDNRVQHCAEGFTV